jgi:hypothetical protein
VATSISADEMLAALKEWGLTPKFYKSDWRTHNRNAAQGWGPLYGFVVHNFGSDTSDPNSLAYLYNGDNARGMPGPLAQFSITDDGSLWIIGWGAANHTGSMDQRLLGYVYQDKVPLTSDFKPNVNFNSPGTVHNVNDNFIGVEMTYGKAPTAAQRATVVRLGACLMNLLGSGYTGGSVVGHREATTDRSDPVGFPMWQLRQDINALLKAGPTPAKPPVVPVPVPAKPTVPTPTPVQEDDMPTVKEVWQTDGVIPSPDPKSTNKFWAPQSYLVEIYKQTVAAKAEQAAQSAALLKALQTLAGGDKIDLDAITEAAKAGAAAALEDKISNADVTLSVSPPQA